MPSTLPSRSLALVLLLCAAGSVPLDAKTRKPAPGDGTVKGALTINGEKFDLTHIYGRKREAWPASRAARSRPAGLGLGCTTASGTLTVGERASPRAFRGTLHITTSNGDEIEEDVTISMAGNKVHLEGGKVSVPESVWTRDVLDLELWEGLMIGGNGTTDYVVLRKEP